MVEHGGGDGAHQTNGSATIDQADPVLGEGFSQADGSFDKTRVCTGTGAAVHADSSDLAHNGHVAPQRKAVKPDELAVVRLNLSLKA
jgi:hypothetical protein